MEYKFLAEKIKYDGGQLKSLFGYLNHRILGDSIVAFAGACDVSFENMVDGEDWLARSPIRGDSMLHFIIEEFGASLELAVTRQRLLTSIVREALEEKSPNIKLTRIGDDLFKGGAKLSISIATVSPVSSLIHFAMNITNENTPVKTLSLNEMKLDPRECADLIASRYIIEMKSIKAATCKVHWVK